MSPAKQDAAWDTVKLTVAACIFLAAIAAIWLPPSDADAHQVTRSDVRERVAAWREHRARQGRPVTHAQWRRVWVRTEQQARRHNQRHRCDRQAPPRQAIRCAFPRAWPAATRVAVCESGLRTTARNGQYLGMFQMGRHERATYGHGPSAIEQARAARRYFDATGRTWGPWECKP